ncbi:rhodanese-like domain-containing protein [uncultured Bilophila sp.]|uniref:rhodanese-like domain-containing protein n=1 Tax=uncultured Bilophila sp. TaxID=529385 RepID=UPI00280B0D34|nr:rhodanese-like domain-containing protein [uncultured Bilophila sp.]
MNTLRSKWFAVLLACVFMFAAYGQAPAAGLPQAGALAPAEAIRLMDSLGGKLTVIDVRTEQEYAQGHVPGAVLLPIQTLREHMDQVPADGSVLLLCRTGRRAEAAYDMIREAYPQKKNLWFLKGIPVYGSDGSFTFK